LSRPELPSAAPAGLDVPEAVLGSGLPVLPALGVKTSGEITEPAKLSELTEFASLREAGGGLTPVVQPEI
jgi:hypothetical protein